MFDASKQLSFSNAHALSDRYLKESRFYCIFDKRVSLINRLIDLQDAFGETSIFGKNLLLDGYFSLDTVKTVLEDLGYELKRYETKSEHFLWFKRNSFTIIKFVVRGI